MNPPVPHSINGTRSPATQPIAARLRKFRVWHKYAGILLATFLGISSVTGILLAWKKDVTLLQPLTQKGVSTNLQEWLPVARIGQIADQALIKHLQLPVAYPVDRLEARPDKGIWKVLFTKGYWEVQVDGKTGAVLSVSRRHSDWIEHLHDGSIINDLTKLISMNLLGVGLLGLLISGIWLYYGPKRLRKLKNRS